MQEDRRLLQDSQADEFYKKWQAGCCNQLSINKRRIKFRKVRPVVKKIMGCCALCVAFPAEPKGQTTNAQQLLPIFEAMQDVQGS